jgi:NADH dehydrogenase [ubiquinone] 1 alpha subcomplex assembly factor 1
LFKFNDQGSIDKWQVNSDAGYEIGNTKCTFTLTEQNTGLFKGYLSNDFDKPEKMKAIYTGYANITLMPQFKAFYRKKFVDINNYTHFRIRLRGDGRNYMFLLKNDQRFKEAQTYLYMHPIYTHGGPYWQDLRIPFSKFFHATHGRVSDRQYRFNEDDFISMGFTCMDGIEGPFSLELDYIGVYRDNEIKEITAYETYKTPKYIPNT